MFRLTKKEVQSLRVLLSRSELNDRTRTDTRTLCEWLCDPDVSDAEKHAALASIR